MKRFFTFSSIQSVKEAVSAGLGIAILSDWTVRKELLAKELFHVEVPNEQLIRPFSIVRGKYFIPSKAIQVFLNHVDSFAKNRVDLHISVKVYNTCKRSEIHCELENYQKKLALVKDH